jgi:hypothetical protein
MAYMPVCIIENSFLEFGSIYLKQPMYWLYFYDLNMD